jgi:TetR/AcrR family transcriptional repressor of nem operon
MQTQSTRIEILDTAQILIQKRGYNGFSYADISKNVAISKASIHHHFPSKQLLGVAVIQRYRENFNQHLIHISRQYPYWRDQISQYGKLYEAVLKEDKLCLCGMLASDMESLPRILKKEVSLFFNENMEWLISVLTMHFKSLPKKRLKKIAWQIISTLQGAILIARMQNDTSIFTSASEELFSLLIKII